MSDHDGDDDDNSVSVEQDPRLTPAQKQAFADFIAEFHRVYASVPDGALVAICLRCGRTLIDWAAEEGCPYCDSPAGPAGEEEHPS